MANHRTKQAQLRASKQNIEYFYSANMQVEFNFFSTDNLPTHIISRSYDHTLVTAGASNVNVSFVKIETSQKEEALFFNIN